MIHPTADVQSSSIGAETNIWQFCVVFKGAIIGTFCNICAHVLIEGDVTIGNRVTVKSGVQLWNGIDVEDDVFIGPNATFTNDLVPRSKAFDWHLTRTLIKRGASIGANATVLAGNVIGEYALIGAGSVVTRDVPPHTIWYGNPARLQGYITRGGLILDKNMRDSLGNVVPLED
jgi:acetyltransferase-like isoleucine patch superfamily enzyme